MNTFTSPVCRSSPLIVDFLLLKARQVWPDAVVVDKFDDVHGVLSPRLPSFIDAEIYASEKDFLAARDRQVDAPNVCVQTCGNNVTIFGDISVVNHLASQPIWRVCSY